MAIFAHIEERRPMQHPVSTQLQAWAGAFERMDVGALVSLYAPEVVFLGTSDKHYRRLPEDIHAYFGKAFGVRTPKSVRLLDHVIQDLGQIAVVTALDRIEWRDGPEPRISQGRVSFVFRQQAGQWKIVSFHRSVLPR